MRRRTPRQRKLIAAIKATIEDCFTPEQYCAPGFSTWLIRELTKPPCSGDKQ